MKTELTDSTCLIRRAGYGRAEQSLLQSQYHIFPSYHPEGEPSDFEIRRFHKRTSRGPAFRRFQD